MNHTPPPSDIVFPSFSGLIDAVQAHAGIQGYMWSEKHENFYLFTVMHMNNHVMII